MDRFILLTVVIEEKREVTADCVVEVEALRILPSLQGDDERIVKEGLAITDFFCRTSTQLTYHGIVLLHQGKLIK